MENLDVFHSMLTSGEPSFNIAAVLRIRDVGLDPDASSIVEGLLSIVKGIVEGSKDFDRFYK